MTIFREALMDYLLAQAAITAIVGAEGVYGFPAPSNVAVPYLIITRISGGNLKNLGGQNGTTEEFWQVSPFSKTDLECEELKEVVISALDTMQPTTMSPDDGDTAYAVGNTYLTEGGIGPDIEESDDDGSEDKIIQKPLTFRILRSINAT